MHGNGTQGSLLWAVSTWVGAKYAISVVSPIHEGVSWVGCYSQPRNTGGFCLQNLSPFRLQNMRMYSVPGACSGNTMHQTLRNWIFRLFLTFLACFTLKSNFWRSYQQESHRFCVASSPGTGEHDAENRLELSVFSPICEWTEFCFRWGISQIRKISMSRTGRKCSHWSDRHQKCTTCFSGDERCNSEH